MPATFQDDLETVKVSKLRASGAITADATSVVVTFGQGDDAFRREVRVVHRKFPNGGSWSFFLCPTCGRRVRKLKLHEKVMCWRCCVQSGLRYRIADGSAAERAEARARRTERLQAQLGGGPLRLRPRPGRVMDRRGALELRLRRARIVGRLSILRGIKDSAEGQ
jgi:hypothetical protein